MPQTVRRTLLALAGSAAAALPTLAQSLPPVHATPSANNRPAPAAPTGYDLFEVIASYAGTKAADARKANDPTATAGWERIRSAYQVTDEKQKAAWRTQTQSQAVWDLSSRFSNVVKETADPATKYFASAHYIFLADLILDNCTAKPESGWVVGKQRLETLHRDICMVAKVYDTPRPSPPTPAPPTPADRKPTAARVEKWDQRFCEEGGFSIDTPRGLQVRTNHWTSDGRTSPKLGAWFECAPADGVRYEVGFLVLSADAEKWGEAAAREYLKKFVGEMRGKGEVVCELPKWFGPNYGLDVVYEARDFACRARAFLIGRRLYFVRVVGPDLKALSTPDAWRFFHSLKLDRRARNLTDLTDPGGLLTFFERYPEFRVAWDHAPQSTRELDEFLDETSRRTERDALLQYNPTWSAYTRKEASDMLMKHLDEVEAEINDPKTTDARRVRLQNYLEGRISIVLKAGMVENSIRESVLKAQRELAARNAYWQASNDAAAERIRTQAVLQAAEEALWRR